MPDRRVFRLFACCMPVKGARRSVLCDLQRERYRFIPNGLHEILTEHLDRTLPEIKAAYDGEYDEEIESYFTFLTENDFGFWTTEPERFPALDLTYDTPARITNVILDCDSLSRHDFPAILAELDGLGCTAMELRFFDEASVATLEAALEAAKGSRLRSIDLLLPFQADSSEENLDLLCAKYPRLAFINVYSSPRDDSIRLPATGNPVNFTSAVIDPVADCGQVHPGYLTVNMALFSESLQFNSCLNRKVSIGPRGEIKNCPAMKKVYGLIGRTPLDEVVARADFRELWTVTKDRVRVCRDCEFRYICVDCRAHIASEDDPLSKPEKCTYDPQTASWAPKQAPPR